MKNALQALAFVLLAFTVISAQETRKSPPLPPDEQAAQDAMDAKLRTYVEQGPAPDPAKESREKFLREVDTALEKQRAESERQQWLAYKATRKGKQEFFGDVRSYYGNVYRWPTYYPHYYFYAPRVYCCSRH